MKKIMGVDEFIRTWNSCDTLSEFVQKTGYESSSARSLASRLRSSGRTLKDFKKREK